MVIYPVEKPEDLIKASTCTYPITAGRFWHNGVHFTSERDPVHNIHTGTVVAMRLTEDCAYDDFTELRAEIVQKLTGDDVLFEKYFTCENNICKIKDGLTEEEKRNALIIVHAAFSNNFVLVKHSVNNLYGKSIEFYSLAMHLRPLNMLHFAEKLQTCWYNTAISVKSSTYNYINVYDDKGIAKDRIPCETHITILSSVITWTLNDEKHTSTIAKSKYRTDDYHKIKRPAGGDENASDSKFLKKGEYGDDGEGLLVYSTGDKQTRAVSYLLKAPENPEETAYEGITLVEENLPSEYEEGTTGFSVSFQLNVNGESKTKTGYIFPEFTSTASSATGQEGNADASVVTPQEASTTESSENPQVVTVGNLTFTQKTVGTWTGATVSVIAPKYNYVTAYKNDGKEVTIPCETPIVETDNIPTGKVTIAWAIDGEKKTGVIDSTKYVNTNDLYKIKSPAYDNDSDDPKFEYCDDGNGLLVYSTGSGKTRVVTHILSPPPPLTLIDKTFINQTEKNEQKYGYKENTGILVRFNDDKEGYIYPEFDGENNSISSFDNALTTMVDKVLLGNLTFKLAVFESALEDRIQKETVYTPPEDLNLNTNDIIGHCGYGMSSPTQAVKALGFYNHLLLPLHYEMFCPDVGFLKEDRPYYYETTREVKCYKEKPVMRENINSMSFTLEEQNKIFFKVEKEEFIAGEKFCKLLFIKKELGNPPNNIPFFGPRTRTLVSETLKTFWIRNDILQRVTSITSIEKGKEYSYSSILPEEPIPFIVNEPLRGQFTLKEGEILEEIDSSYECFDVDSEKTELWIGLKYYKNIENAMDGVGTEVWVKKNEWAGGTIKNVTKKGWNDYFFYLSKNDGAGYSPSSFADLFNQNNETDRTLGEKFQNDMNANNTKEDLQNAIKNCEPLRKLVYQNTTEWKIDEDYVNALCGSFKKNRERINAQQKALAFTATDVNDANTTNWYFHPIRFIRYLNKVATPNPFNPYEGKTLTPRFAVGNDSRAIIVKSCPGFAPLSSYLDEKRFPSILQDTRNEGSYWGNLNCVAGYSNGYFNGDKLHTGVDFAGNTDDPIVSMITGEVWATTWQGKVLNTEESPGNGYGKLMIIKDLNKPLLYLIAHLEEYKKNEGDIVYPGETVALVGNTGGSKGAHLHLEVFKCEQTEKTQVLDQNANKEYGIEPGLKWKKIGGKLIFDRHNNRLNPLDHSEHIKE